MKKILLLSVFCMGAVTLQAQTTDEAHGLEEMPEFPGGEKGMNDFLDKNLTYPKSAKKQKIEGKVWVGFVVDKDGNVQDVEVLKGVSPELDAEAVRVIKLMPKWTPGKQSGTPVITKFRLPIIFSLH